MDVAPDYAEMPVHPSLILKPFAASTLQLYLQGNIAQTIECNTRLIVLASLASSRYHRFERNL